MKPLAVIETDRRTGRAALLGANHGRPGVRGAQSLQIAVAPVSQTFGENDAKD